MQRPSGSTTGVVRVQVGGSAFSTFLSAAPVKAARLLGQQRAESVGVFADEACVEGEHIFRLEWTESRTAWLHLEVDEGTGSIGIQADDAASTFYSDC